MMIMNSVMNLYHCCIHFPVCSESHLLNILYLCNIFCKLCYFSKQTNKICMRIINGRKKELFRSLSEFAPSRGPLTILEVGCGTGANFEFYPAGSRVLCTDPNPHFQKYLKTNIEKNDHLTYEQFVVASGEDLGSFEDESVDAVVCTLVLCSVRDVTATLREAIRVLRPVSCPAGAALRSESDPAPPPPQRFNLLIF
uniref:Methyltransferase type 11 domain-containing protein n=1 Tax=Oryzias latipes TaxID=8090 RepID=A0A3B3I9W0_ORYLA